MTGCPRRRQRPSSKAGFALPLVLTMVTVLALTFLTCILALNSLRDETRQALASIEFERNAMTAEARFLYLIATEPLGFQGVRIGGTRLPANGQQLQYAEDYQVLLRIDDRPYLWRETLDQTAGATPYVISIQDEAGLANVDQLGQVALGRLFQQVGVDVDAADALALELLEYRAQPVEPIRRLAELYKLPSAADLLTERRFRELTEITSVIPLQTMININTAPAPVLKAWFDLSDSQIELAISDRETIALSQLAQIGAAQPIDFSATTTVFPNGRFRFTFTDARTGQSYRSNLVLTPSDQEHPFWIENPRRLRLNTPEPALDDLEDFPEIPNSPA